MKTNLIATPRAVIIHEKATANSTHFNFCQTFTVASNYHFVRHVEIIVLCL